MILRYGQHAAAIVAAMTIILGPSAAIAASSEKKAAGGQGKHSACLAKARAENPDRAAGHARQATYNRCMGR